MTSSSSEQPSPSRDNSTSSQNNLLIGILVGLLIIVIAAIAYLIFERRPANVIEPSPQIVNTPIVDTDPTSTPSPTSSATLRPTFTPKPTRTATITPTASGTPLSTLIPSLTPAFPSEFNDQYLLIPWTPELATELIALMEVYPETLSSFARGTNDQGYFDAFQYALFAQGEALHRFSTASQASEWLWQYAYNLARTGDSTAGQVYAEIITQELNKGDLEIEDLTEWGLNLSPQITLNAQSLNSSQGEAQNWLVSVSIEENGSSYFWLIEDSGGFVSYPLTSDFNFIQPSEVDYFIDSLVGTNNTVVGIYPTTMYDTQQYVPPRIFELSQRPPQELQFEEFSPPPIAPEFVNIWEPIQDDQTIGDLQFSDTLFAACPVTVTHTYEWNGFNFTFLFADYQIEPETDLLGYCEIVVNHAINTWGVEPTIQLMEQLLPSWPPELTPDGDPYPADALDEWQYRLSIYHALLGDQAKSREYANNIVSNPTSTESTWISPAEDFLETYQDQRDIYQACLPSIFCNPRYAFQSLVETINPQEMPDLINILRDNGVSIRSNGYFDFDNDGETERWIVVRHHPGTPLELWIIFSGETNLEPVFVKTMDTDEIRILFVEPLSEPPTVVIEPDFTFTVVRQGPEQEPIIVIVEQTVVFSSDRTAMDLDFLEATLFSGGDPAFVRDELLVLRDSPHFTCSYLLCPRYLYLLGLSNELAKDDRLAVDAYLELWRNFIDSPYATMARFKLLSTITPAPTFTQTSTITATLGITSTVTPTETTTEVIPTETIPGYPYPYPYP